MATTLDELMPELRDGEIVIPQIIRLDGDDIVIPLHVFAGDGRSVSVVARFNGDSATDEIMKAALEVAIHEAREHLQ